MKYGRFFTDTENTHHMPVVVIGEDVAKQLLPNRTRWASGSRGRARDADRGRDGPAGGVAAGAGRYARAAAVLHDAQDVPQRAGAHADRRWPIRAMAEAQDEVRAALRISRRVPFNAPDNFAHDHGGADDRGIPPGDRDGGAGDGDFEFDRSAGGRHRRDEHHAGERDGADAGRSAFARRWARARATSSCSF